MGTPVTTAKGAGGKRKFCYLLLQNFLLQNYILRQWKILPLFNLITSRHKFLPSKPRAQHKRHEKITRRSSRRCHSSSLPPSENFLPNILSFFYIYQQILRSYFFMMTTQDLLSTLPLHQNKRDATKTPLTILAQANKRDATKTPLTILAQANLPGWRQSAVISQGAAWYF